MFNDLEEWFDWFDANLRRMAAAKKLARAVAQLEPEDRLPFLEAIFDALRAGPPIPVFVGILEEAHLWATQASDTEREAYLWAIWLTIREHRRKAFLDHVKDGSVA